jgi:cytoskeleton protein RodZ
MPESYPITLLPVACAHSLSYHVPNIAGQIHMGAFGDKFRKARESKELSFDDVSKVIKIGPRMLQAIEAEQFDQLPGGVFNKGFIRAYAKHLGLDSEEAIAEYLECVRQAQVQAQQAWQPERQAEPRPPAAKKPPAITKNQPAAMSDPAVQVEELPELHLPRAEDVRPARKSFSGKSSPEIPWRLIAAAAVVAILGFLLWSRHARVVHSESAPAKKEVSSSASVAPGAAQGQSQTLNATSPQPAAVTSAAANPDVEDRTDVTVHNFGKPLPKVTESSSGSLTLVVRASENSWISVVADGQVVAEETLIAPANTTFRASNEFVVKVGNAAAVSFLVNGKEIAPQGSESEVKTLTFDSSGLKTAP